MKIINIRFKTQEEMDRDFPNWQAGRGEYGSPTYYMRNAGRHELGKDITHELGSYYTLASLVPNEVVRGGRKISKQVLVTYVDKDKPDIRILKNGFLKPVISKQTA